MAPAKNNKFYTYAYLRKSGKPYYIGKGSGERAYKSSGRFATTPVDRSKILILKSGLSEDQAFRHEMYMISVFGRKNNGTGILLNLTDGGEGSSGRVLSSQTKEKIRKKILGKKAKKSVRLKMSASRKGRYVSIETRRKKSLSMRGKNTGPRTEEFKAKVSNTMLLKERSKYVYEVTLESGEKINFKSLANFCRARENFDYSAALKAAKNGKLYKGVLLRIVEKK